VRLFHRRQAVYSSLSCLGLDALHACQAPACSAAQVANTRSVGVPVATEHIQHALHEILRGDNTAAQCTRMLAPGGSGGTALENSPARRTAPGLRLYA
jgi:hypothetical protein